MVVAIAIFATRFRPVGSAPPAETNQGRLTAIEARDEAIIRTRRFRGKALSIILIILGVLLIVAAPSLIRAFFMSYIGGGIIIITGLALLYFLSRHS